MQKVKASCRDDGCNCDKDNVRVVCGLTLARDGLRAEMNQQDHVIKLEQSLVQEDSQAPEALIKVNLRLEQDLKLPQK